MNSTADEEIRTTSMGLVLGPDYAQTKGPTSRTNRATVRPDALPARRAKALSCTFVVVLLLGATRWGSYVGAKPFFLTDALIAVALISRVGVNLNRGARRLSGYLPRQAPGLIFGLFLAYVTARVAVSVSYLGSQDWVRDSAPYLYGYVGLLSAWSAAVATEPERRKTMNLIWGALLFHLVWTVVAALVGSVTKVTFPGSPIAVFTIRPDVDAAVLGITAGLLLRRCIVGSRPFFSGLGVAIASLVIIQLGTRAGLIALVVAMAVAIGVAYSAIGHRPTRRSVVAILCIFAILGTLLALPNTLTGQRLIGTFNPNPTGDVDEGTARAQAHGTANARRRVWSGVIDWTAQGRARQIFGAGYGVDFLIESNTVALLQGVTEKDVRSPHNWIITTYARLGVLGLVLVVVLLLQLVMTLWRKRRRIGEDELLMAAALIVVAMIPVALLGVVLEAPFGAVPFFWAAGLVLALRERSSLFGELGRVEPPQV